MDQDFSSAYDGFIESSADGADYTNWGSEREKVIDDVLDIQRQQEDDKQNGQVSGTFQINPQLFKQGTHLLIGPISLGTSFKQIHINYDQQPATNEGDTRVGNLATNYTPFLVQSYTHSYQFTSGEISGFFVGLYAITEPASQTTHTISWQGTGRASRYIDQRTTEAWVEPDDAGDADFMQEDVEYPDEYYDELGEFD